MEKYYVVGAQQKNGIYKDWEQYQKGVILKVFPEQNLAEKCVEYVSPKEVIPDNFPSISFTAATIKNDHLYVGTQTEILVYSLPNFQKVGYLSYPCFNDIHHVLPTSEGNLLVVNTGLDMVLEISPQGNILKEWHVFGEKIWRKFSRSIDYRKVPTTKPHQSHPNFVFQIGKDIWATRCLQEDAICLTKPNQQIKIGGEKVHDGIVFGDSIYFTQVNGQVVRVNIHTLKVEQKFNLNNFTNTSRNLGWCRGINVLDEYKVIVGFTRIRPSKKYQADGTIIPEGNYGILPTRIACYDLKHGKLLWEQQLEDYDLNAIYSIHKA
ncbi:hypothetical protein P4576_27065 [Peribacillus frigoritolerans]|uniref:hypothetical protein n=1 Tax=Peribacillus frigoritolerans TaxID=450367 RepID=UPI002E1D0D0A|nr:hypothetical protein [Peribacillus frigoritolerans]